MSVQRRIYVSVAYTHAIADARVRRHCETLARRGWRVLQLGLARNGEHAVGRSNGVIYIRFGGDRYRGRNLIRYAWSYLRFFIWARSLLRRIRRLGNVAVVHANNLPNFVMWVTLPARRAGAGVIFDIHDPLPELFLCKFG